MALDIDGKVALITGGSNGIGEGVARHLAGRGAHVVIADIDGARGKAVAKELDGRFIQTDVTDPAASTAAVALAVEAFGGLHIAHLNAGVTSWCGMGDDFDPEAYRRSMAINLDGVVYGIAAARPAIMASGGGTIVATASMAGLVVAPFDPPGIAGHGDDELEDDVVGQQIEEMAAVDQSRQPLLDHPEERVQSPEVFHVLYGHRFSTVIGQVGAIARILCGL